MIFDVTCISSKDVNYYTIIPSASASFIICHSWPTFQLFHTGDGWLQMIPVLHEDATGQTLSKPREWWLFISPRDFSPTSSIQADRKRAACPSQSQPSRRQTMTVKGHAQDAQLTQLMLFRRGSATWRIWHPTFGTGLWWALAWCTTRRIHRIEIWGCKFIAQIVAIFWDPEDKKTNWQSTFWGLRFGDTWRYITRFPVADKQLHCQLLNIECI